MKELEIQRLLRLGKTYESIERTYGIKARVSADGKLVNLKYCQIKSDKHLPIVQECRGIILEVGTWNVVARGFERFFNYGEEVRNWDKVDYNSTDLGVFEKVDGSIITMFNYEDEWRISTSGVIDASSNINGGVMTFKDLFDKAVSRYESTFYDHIDKKYIYVFELISPYNRVVTEYSYPDVRVLSMRHADTMEELHIDEINEAKPFNVLGATRFMLNGIDGIMESLYALPYKQEGFVVVDFNRKNEFGNFARVKMKTEEYVRLHHLKDSVGASPRRLVEVVVANEGDEVSATFPEFEEGIRTIETIYKDYKKDFVKSWLAVAHLHVPDMSREEIATYAKAVMSEHKAYSWLLFKMRTTGIRDTNEVLDQVIEDERERKTLIVTITELYTDTFK
jgi:T4 RnlA family RNA ligase